MTGRVMFDLGEPDTLWLDFTNITLGLVTLAACLWVGWGVVREVVFRLRLRKKRLVDDHAVTVPGLGVTMADGGEKLADGRPSEPPK